MSKSALNYDSFINVLFSRVPRADVTLGLVLVNALIFVLVAWTAGNFSQIPSDLLIRVGGNFAPLVQKGEWWRIAAAMFLHGGLLHIALNMFALYQAGQVVERLFGRLGFGVIYLGAGLLGNLASLWWKQSGVSVGASGAIFGVYGALLAYLSLQRGSVPGEIFREMRAGTLGFIGYSLFAGFAIAGIDNAAHIGGLIGGFVLGAAFATPVIRARPVNWFSARALAGLIVVVGLAAVLWTSMPQVARKYELDSAFQHTLQQFSLEEQTLLREQGALLESLRVHSTTSGVALDTLEHELIPRWEHLVGEISDAQTSPANEWQRQELIHYANTRCDALKALAQGLTTREAIWLERSKLQEVQAENILLQMRLRKSLESARP